MSLRLKISLLSALISGLILLGFGLASWFLMYRERLAAVDREIRTLAVRHPGWLANRQSHERLTSLLEFTFGEQRKDNILLLIRDDAGVELYRSPHWPQDLDPAELDFTLAEDPAAAQPSEQSASDSAPPRLGPPWGPGGGGGPGRMGRGYGRAWENSAPFTKRPRFLTANAGETSWRLGILGNAQTTLVLGINQEEVQRDLHHLRNAFLVALPLALLLVGVGGWIIGTRALRPLKLIADTVEGVTARGLGERIPAVDSDPVVARLVRMLNGMMDRLEKSFHQATRFTADASHELKTPLTIMQGELDNALQHAPSGSREQQVFTNLLEETQRLKKITRNLLLLAQADSGQLKLAREPVNLSELLRDTLEDARILASDSALAFEAEIDPNLEVHGDPHLLAMSLHNLLGNAVRYNEPSGRLSVQAQREAGRVRIRIGNTGPGIPEPDQSRVFERFYRAQQSGARAPEGSGLGLSLAREVVRAHGGDIVLLESRPGWTLFEICL